MKNLTHNKDDKKFHKSIWSVKEELDYHHNVFWN